MRFICEAAFVAATAFLLYLTFAMDRFDFDPRSEPIIYYAGRD